MTMTSPLAPSPATTEDLINDAHRRGIRVWWRPLPGRDGAWSQRHRSIWLDPRLTAAETRSLLAHELGHAALGHDGPQSRAAECRTWRHAARRLITDDEYAVAEDECGPHPGALAAALDVTREIVTAYQEALTRRTP